MTAEKLLCAIIRGDAISALSFKDQLKQVVDTAFQHSVHLIIFDVLKKSSAWNHWPPRLQEQLQRAALLAATMDLFDERQLQRVLICLDRNGIQSLLLKGVPLAYTLYESPAMRPRGDTDILIRESDVQRAVAVLRELGYDGPDPQANKLASYECLFRRTTAIGTSHNVDVHWKINNAQLFAKTFTFDELLVDAIKIPSLAPCALGLGYTHAPFYVNGGTVYAGDHLRWVYDVHLLCSALTPGQWSEFATLATAKNIAEFCVDCLNRSKEAFHTQIPLEIMDALLRAAENEPASAQKLKTSTGAWFLANLNALPNMGQRIKLIKHTVFPPSAYMMAKYECNMRLALPLLYGYRSVKGILKAFKPSNFT
jgi:Uncharacterised nucleotidyltransferase